MHENPAGFSDKCSGRIKSQVSGRIPLEDTRKARYQAENVAGFFETGNPHYFHLWLVLQMQENI